MAIYAPISRQMRYLSFFMVWPVPRSVSPSYDSILYTRLPSWLEKYTGEASG